MYPPTLSLLFLTSLVFANRHISVPCPPPSTDAKCIYVDPPFTAQSTSLYTLRQNQARTKNLYKMTPARTNTTITLTQETSTGLKSIRPNSTIYVAQIKAYNEVYRMQFLAEQDHNTKSFERVVGDKEGIVARIVNFLTGNNNVVAAWKVKDVVDWAFNTLAIDTTGRTPKLDAESAKACCALRGVAIAEVRRAKETADAKSKGNEPQVLRNAEALRILSMPDWQLREHRPFKYDYDLPFWTTGN